MTFRTLRMNLLLQKYRILGKKGEGTFSEVLKCQHIKDGTYWACKKMKQTYESIEQVNNLREIQAMRRLSPHSNILELQEVIFDKKSGTLVLICELMDMNIYELIRGKRHYLPERKVKHYMYQLLKSVEHMHSMYIIRKNTVVLFLTTDRAYKDFQHKCQRYRINIVRTSKFKQKQHYMPESVVQNYMYQLLRSVTHMHRHGIFHRDVKPENILIKEDLLKLADFGSCRSVYSKQPYTEYISTRWYRAPECLLTDGYYTYKMDMWSVGCVFFEILSLHPLFPGSNEVDQIAKIHDILGTPDPSVLNKLKKSRGMNFNFPPKKGSGIERLLPHVSTDAVELIYQMCTYDPDDRMSAKQALRHQYFKDLRDADKRAAMMAKAKQQNEDKDKKTELTKPTPPTEATVSPDLETSRSEKKKSDSDTSISTVVPSLPKAQSLPSHPHIFKDRKRVPRRNKKIIESHQFTNHTGLNLPKVPVHTGSINPSFHAAAFSGSYSTTLHNGGTMSLLPSINSTYKPHKATSKATKNIFSTNTYLPSLDRRGAGF